MEKDARFKVGGRRCLLTRSILTVEQLVYFLQIFSIILQFKTYARLIHKIHFLFYMRKDESNTLSIKIH